jgi:hypothetical protein
MKKLLYCLFFWGVAFAAWAQLKVVDGKLYNVQKAAFWSKPKGELKAFLGTNTLILQETSEKTESVRIPSTGPASYGNLIGGGQPPRYRVISREKVYGRKFVIKNYQTTGTIQIGEDVSCFAMIVGTTNIQGEVLPLYDYGTFPSPEIIAARKTEVDALMASQKHVQKEASQKRDTEAESKIIAYQIQQATNGYPSSQYDLAIRYATGRGLPQDIDQTRHWLTAAMTNGSTEASNAFRKYFKGTP